MASIIKENSMGRSAERQDRPGNHKRRIHGSGLNTVFSRKNSLRTASLLFLVLFSALFFIYCRTNGHTGHVPVEASAADTTVVETAPTPPQEIQGPALPDLSSVINLKEIPYDPGVLRGVFWREKDFGGQYYLTFDDGPNRSRLDDNRNMTVCASILDTLDSYGLKAVFFINGKNLEYGSEEEKKSLQDLLIRIIDDGHLLGNHSYSHHNLARGIYADGENDREDIEAELVRTQTALDEILGFSYPLVLVRPPYAEPGRSDTFDTILKESGEFLISLQFDSYDYAYKEDGLWNDSTIENRVISLLSEQPEGGVLLLHELDSTARMLPAILDNIILTKQFSIGRLDDFLCKKYGRSS